MSTDNININVNEKGIVARSGRTNVNDNAALQEISKLLKLVNKDTAKNIGSTLEKLLKPFIRDIVLAQTPGKGGGISGSDVERIVKSVSREQASVILKSIVSVMPKSSQRATDDNAISAAIERGLNNSSKQLTQAITNQLGKLGVKVDTKDLQSGILGMIRNVVPKSLEISIKNLNTTVGKLISIMRDMSSVVDRAKGMRASGGGIDFSEAPQIISMLKHIRNEFKEMRVSAEKTKQAFSDIVSESKDLKANASSAIDKVLSEGKSMVTGVKSRAKDDPKTFARDVVSMLSSTLNKSGDVKGTQIAKAIDRLSQKVDDVGKFTSELSKLPDVIKIEIEKGGLDANTLKSVLGEVDKVFTHMGALPQKLGIGGKLGKEWNAVADSFSKFKKNMNQIVVTVKPIVDLKDLKKQIPTLEIPMRFIGARGEIKKSVAEFNKEQVKVDRAKSRANMDALSRFKKPDYSSGLEFYKTELVKPSKSGSVDKGEKDLNNYMTKSAQNLRAATEKNIEKLSESLHKLQEGIVNTLDKQFEEAGKKWAVVKSPAAERDPTKAFKNVGRQWKLQIADVKRLQYETGDYQSSAEGLIKKFKAQISGKSVAKASTAEEKSQYLGQWLKTISDRQIRAIEGIGPKIKADLVKIKSDFVKGVEVSTEMKSSIKSKFGEGDNLTAIFRKTYAEAEAKRKLLENNLVRNVAIPSANITKEGAAAFQTVHGSQRALPKFVKFETGFEVLYKKLEDLGKLQTAQRFNNEIRNVGIRPASAVKEEAESLAREMLKAVTGELKDKGTYVREAYKGAAKIKLAELKESGASVSGYEKRTREAFIDFSPAKQEKKGVLEFADAMKKVGLDATDAVKSLNRIEVKNVYDIIGDVLKGSEKSSPLGKIAKHPEWPKPIREYEKAIREVEGLMPLLEKNRPRRGFHQENVVNLLTRTGSFYGESGDRLEPPDQKKLIKDLNLEIADTLKNIKSMGKDSPVGIRRLTTLGIPESQAGNLEEYRESSLATGQLKHLKTLNATSVKLYADDLTSLAPFKQFQQAGRNIANVTNAMAGRQGADFERPKLRSQREDTLIKSGRYGTGGYGFNVTAELRNTAANFEDQILIAGKLAKAATKAVSTLVEPSQTGRLYSGSESERQRGQSVGDITEGLINKSASQTEKIEKAAGEFMKILGKSETYKGRSDKAFISDVKKTISVIRGEDVEVQKAKLAETFFDYFGRKLTTRYGSKGVSVTPTGQPEGLAGILQEYSTSKIEVDTSATLGHQIAPKSLGKMASELFGKDVSEELKDKLISSGNKFMIDIFQDPKVVDAEEAEKTKKLYEEFAAKWQQLFKSEVPKVGVGGVKDLRKFFKSEIGETEAFELKPIDVRISSYGAAKRGLQTEFMESIFSNLAGTGAGDITTLEQFKKPTYERLLKKGGALSEYSEALGYKGSEKDLPELEQDLFKIFGGKGKIGESDDKEKVALAKRAAAIEEMSKYYSTVIDEFGKKRKGLVGEKFLQIIEEPGEDPEWSRKQIESGVKGAKLNLPAFSAYSTIFGESSAMMGELKGSLSINTKKHWEYLKALQTMHDKDSEMYGNITKGLKTVDVGQLKAFDLATGVFDEKGDGERSLINTVLDLERYPEAFKMSIPTGRMTKEGAMAKEDFYVPGAAARGTYAEPLIAGEKGMDQLSRRLTHVVNMAKKLEDIIENPSQITDQYTARNKVAGIVGTWTKKSSKLFTKSGKTKRDDPEDLEFLKGTMKRMGKALSRDRKPNPSLAPKYAGGTEYKYMQSYFDDRKKEVAEGERTQTQAYASTVNAMGDLLIGKNPKIATDKQASAHYGLKRALESGTVGEFAGKMGIDLGQEELEKNIANLQKAKIDYYYSLAKTTTGKKGSVNELLFTRKIPAVLAKATTAVVDKRKDIVSFSTRLSNIQKEYGVELGSQISELSGVSEAHGKAIKKYQDIGIPTLGQREIGIPEGMASKISLKDKDYVESIRFPFTGTSSVVPFKAKVMERDTFTSKEGKDLGQNTVLVPGIPEGMEKLAPIIEQIQEMVTGFYGERETKAKEGGPQEEIDDLTDKMNALNAAISDIIPKYMSQAQKLDFDGDTIEIHAAKSAKAGKEIEDHFKRFHVSDPSKPQMLQDVFMKRFLAGGAEVKTTGDYVFGEAAGAFEKKFPAGKGFDFMKSPFLTKELEYMDTAGALKVLSGDKGIGDVSNVITGVLSEIGKTSDIKDDTDTLMSKISELNKEDPDEYVNNIMRAIEGIFSGGTIQKQIEHGVKKRLYEKKFKDTIEAQLFKVHTGTETEGIYRVHRIGEAAAGFGSGLIGGERQEPSKYFSKRFPTTVSTGDRPEEDFNTMINELLRFGIQKGLDVKHAGEEPVAGKIVTNLTTSGGVEKLWENIQGDDSLKELSDFAKDSAETIKMRIGGLKTEDILSEAKTIISARGGSTEKLDSASREKLIDIIIEQVGFKGFLSELSLLIRKEAVSGLISQAEKWSPTKRGEKGIKGDIESWAQNKVSKQMSTDGINIRDDISKAVNPLYLMRTFGATPYGERESYEDNLGDVTIPQEEIFGLSGKTRKNYVNMYKNAKATAANLKQELNAFKETERPGAYSDMINSAMEEFYKQQDEIAKYVTSFAEEGYDPKEAKGIGLAERIISKKGISKFAKEVIGKDDINKRVEELSDLVGLPGLEPQRLREIEDTTLGEFSTVKGEDPERMVEQAQALKQLDRIIDVLISKQYEGRVLQDLFPREVRGTAAEHFKRARGRSGIRIEDFATGREDFEGPGERGSSSTVIPPFGGGAGIGRAGGNVIPVHLVGAESSAVVTVKGLEAFALRDPAIGMDATLKKAADNREKMRDTLSRIAPAFEGPRSYKDVFSPSRLAGGGEAYPELGKKLKPLTEERRKKEQLEKLKESMTKKSEFTERGQSVVDLGSLFHAKIQKFFKDSKTIDIERYGEIEDAVGGTIAGTADMIEYATPEKKKVSKVIDIKSTTSKKMEVISSAIKKAGTTELGAVSEHLDEQTKRQLNDYFSQLNAYLKIFDETAEAQLRFYDKSKLGKDPKDFELVTVKFDPDRFKKDMDQLATAREEVVKSGEPFREFSNKPIGRPDIDKWPTGRELDEAMRATGVLGKKYIPQRISGRAREGDEENIKRDQNMVLGASRSRSKRSMLDKLTPEDLDKYLLPPQPAEGKDAKALLTNLTLLHDQAKIYQQMKGIDMGAISSMPESVGKAIGSVAESGPDYQEFIDLTNKLKDEAHPKFKGDALNKAWKMYRAAIGDFLIKKAEEAEEQISIFADEGDARASNKAYGEFQSRVSQLQETVRRSIGKPTDLYTDDKRFVYPGLAQAAGVYLNPKQIMEKSGEPLGDDPKLIERYKEIARGLQNSTLKAPITSAREIYEDLSGLKKDMVEILASGEKFGRMGEGVSKVWGEFDKLTERATRLREALQKVYKQSGEMNAEQRKNIESVIKYLKNMEGMYSHMDFSGGEGYGQMGIIPVPTFETPEVQKGLYSRNVQAIREYFKKPEEKDGPSVGDRFSYPIKIKGEAGEVIKNDIAQFRKFGEETLASGEKVGLFSENYQDLIEKMQKGNASFGSAIRRVTMWGAASRLVYGGIAYLSKSIDEISQVETGMAQLRMVMNPMETDFNKMGKSATGFAKQYGVPVTDVLKSMKIFAQQGLKQEDVVDRTQTATIAANVTTLNAKDATEALTAAMKVFREEGTQSLRFLDSWSEVEAKHAITAEDMANAIKKSAAAAKTAGFTFDQLNGIVAAIGATTRQSGKEVGTSLRFIARRMFSEEGPKALAKLPTPITTITGGGEKKTGFKILSELSSQWKDLTSAQKLNIAQSIGGTRQYNALLVLMDQWDEALRGIRNSTNSKGSAERRNLEIMKTYAKQLEQTKAAATELKVEIGKVILPTFKVGLKGLKLLTEAVTGIPGPVKIAATSALLMFGAFAKGVPIIDSIFETISKGKSVFNEFGNSLSKQFKIAKYEITGKGVGKGLYGLKTLTSESAERADGTMGTDVSDFHSSLGKVLFITKEIGKSYNEMVGNVISGTGKISETVGEKITSIGDLLTSSNDLFGVVDILQAAASEKGIGEEDVKRLIAEQGIAGMKHLTGPIGEYMIEGAGYSAMAMGKMMDTSGEFLGDTGQKILKNFASENTGLIKAIAPLAVTITALAPALKIAYGEFKKLSGSAQDFERSRDAMRKTNEKELQSIRAMIDSYDTLSDKVKDINKASEPETKKRRLELGTYESPLVGAQKIQKDVISLSNQLAESNLTLVVGYDKLGNAVLKSTDNFKSYLKELESLKALQGIEVRVGDLDAFVKDLTETGGSEKFKVIIKDLAESFPVIGDLVSRNIKIAPAKALEIASDDINKRLSLKQKYPLSTGADKDIKRLQKVLAKARAVYQDSYSDFERIYQGIFSQSSIKGLDSEQIVDLLTSPSMKKAYELRLEVDPKFKLVSGVTVEDIMGKEILNALNPNTIGLLDVTSEFTKANLESAGFQRRTEDRVYSGDIVTVMESAVKKYDMAGNDAIVKLKETSDGVFNWVAEYFNTKTLDVEQRPLSDIEPFIDNIFPVEKIKEDLSYRMDALNTIVAGAGAGLVGIDKKKFKKEFSLGDRFFGDIATTTLLQGDFGFMPGSGYGKVPGTESFTKDIEEFYFKPMDELRSKTDQLEKLKLEGLDADKLTLDDDMYDSITRLLTVLKNNQVVLQFKAVFVDLMKEFADGERILKQNVRVLENRMAIEKETSGLMEGVSKGLGDFETGIFKVGDLTARQSLLRESAPARELAKEIKVLTVTSEGQLSQLDNVQKALVDIEEISNLAKSSGVTIDEGNLSEFVSKVVKNTDDSGPFKDINANTERTADNTAATVDGINRLNDGIDMVLSSQGDTDAVERMLSSFSDNIGSFMSTKSITKSLERVAEIRKSAEKGGNQEGVIAANKVLDQLTKKLINTVGFKKGAEEIERGYLPFPFKKDFTSMEFKQRAFSGIDPEVFIKKMEKFGPYKEGTSRLFGQEGSPNKELMSKIIFGSGETFAGSREKMFGKDSVTDSNELKRIRKLQENDGKKTLISGKTLAKVQAGVAAASYFEKRGNNKVIVKLDEQIDQIDTQIEQRKKEGAAESEINKLELKKKGVSTEREKMQKSADFYGTVAALSATGVAASELAMAFGLTEGQVKALNVAAVGTYGSMKIVSSIMGEEMPESAKKFGKEFGNVALKLAKGEKPDEFDLSRMKNTGAALTKDVADKTKKAFSRTKKEIDSDMKQQLKENAAASDAGEVAVRGAKVGADTSRMSQALAVYLTTAAVDYASKKGAERTELSTLESSMKDQQAAISDLFDRYPDVAEKVFNEVYKSQSVGSKAGESEGAEMVTKSLVQSTEDGRNKIEGLIKTSEEKILKIHEELAKRKSEKQAEFADMEMRKEYKLASERAVIADKNNRLAEKINRQYSLSNIIQKGLSGFGEIALPVPKEEMSTQQRLYAESGDEFKNMINEYIDGVSALESMTARIVDLKSNISDESELISTSDNKDVVKDAKVRHSELNGMLEKQIELLDKHSKGLNVFAESYVYLNRFTDAVEKFKSSLKDVSIQESVDRMSGIMTLNEERDKLLGGSHPDALRSVTPEIGRMGRRAGMDLGTFATQYDIEKANLKGQLPTATGQQYIDINKQLRDLPLKREAELVAREQGRHDSALQRSLTPLREQISMVERVKTLPGLPDDMRGSIDKYLEDLNKIGESAYNKMPIKDYISELDKNKKSLGDEEYNRQRGILAQLEGAGIDTVRRGMPEWDKLRLSETVPEGIKDKYKEYMKETPLGVALEGVSGPIVSVVDTSNSILRDIRDNTSKSDKSEEPKEKDTESKSETGKLQSLYNYLFKIPGREKKSIGGSIYGPGGPTTDSIPAMLSDGEFVIKSSSAGRIGHSALNYMNETGKVPAFSEGGSPDDWKRGFRTAVEDKDKFIEDLRKKRLSNDLPFYKEAGLWGQEIGTNLLTLPMSAIADVEGTVDYLRKNGVSGAVGDASKFISGVKEQGIGSYMSSVGSSLVDYLKEDVSTGATGIISNVIGALIPAGILSKTGKTGKAVKASKIAGAEKKELFKGTRLVGSTDQDMLRKLSDEYEEYSKILPGITGENIDVVSVGGDVSKLYDILGHRRVNSKSAVLGSHFVGKRAEEAADVMGVGIKKGAGVVSMSKDAFSKEVFSKIGDPSTIFRHELIHDMLDESTILNSFINKSYGSDIPKGLKKFKDVHKELKSYGEARLSGLGGAKTKYSEYEKRIKKDFEEGHMHKSTAISEMVAETGSVRGENISKIIKKFEDEDLRKDVSSVTSSPEYKKSRLKTFGLATGGAVKRYTAYGDDITKYDTKEEYDDAVLAHRASREKNSFKLKKSKRGDVRRFTAYKDSDPIEYSTKEAYEEASKASRFANMIKKIKEDEEDKILWAPETIKSVNETILNDRRRGDRLDTESYMGIGGEWPTKLFEESEKAKESFRLDSANRKSRYDYARTDAMVSMARNADTADPRTGLVNVKGSPLSYQMKSAYRTVDPSYQAKNNLDEGYETPTSFLADPEYAKLKAVEEERKKKALDNVLIYNPDVNYKDLPYGIGKLKRNYDMAYRALTYVQNDKVDVNDNELGKLKKNFYNTRDLLMKVQGGVDPKSEKMTEQMYLATVGGERNKAGRVVSTEKNPIYKNLSRFIVGLGIEQDRRELTGLSSPNDSFMFNPKVYREFEAGLKAWVLSPEEKEKYRNKLETKKGYGFAAHVGTEFKSTMDKYRNYSKDAPPTRVTSVDGSSLRDKLSQEDFKKLLDMLEKENTGATSSVGRVSDFFKSMLRRPSDFDVAGQFHHGGTVNKSGKYFLNKGELISPKGYFLGGPTTGDTNAMSFNTPTITIDGSALIAKLEELELKVEDRIFEVKDKIFAVEDKELKVEDRPVKVDVSDVPKLEVDDSNLPKIEVEQPSWQIGVEKPDWKVQVEIPTDTVTVKVDLGGAEDKLRDAITTALGTAIKVDTSGAAGNAVGGEKFDQLAKTVSDVNNKLIKVKIDLEDKINMLGTDNNQTMDISREVVSIVDIKLAGVQQDLNDMRTSIGDISSNQRLSKVYFETKVDELYLRLNQVSNITGVGIGGLNA